MEDEFVDLDETGGDTAEMQIATVSTGETESILVVLTSIFLLIAISLVTFKLYTNYGFFKSPNDLKEERAAIANKYK